MKKFKIIASIVLLCALVAYFVCSIVIPEQISVFNEYATAIMGKPIVIAGVSTTLGGIFVFIVTKFILTNTKFGRKELDKIRTDATDAREQMLEYQDTINNELEDVKRDIADFKQNCEDNVAIVINEFTDVQKMLLASLKTIPNKKVQAIVAEYEVKFEERKAEIIEKVTNSNNYIDNKLKEMFDEFMKKVEDTLNEKGKETVDPETKAN